MIVGEDLVYTVKNSDTLELVGARTGVNCWKIVIDNNIDTKKRLPIGRQLRANARRIVPAMIDNGIIINLPDRTLYCFRDAQLARSFPVGLGMLTSKPGMSLKTTKGKFRIIAKKEGSDWECPALPTEKGGNGGKRG